MVHLRQRLDNTVSSSRDRTFPLDTILNMIQALVDCDEFQDIATLRVCFTIIIIIINIYLLYSTVVKTSMLFFY